MPELTPDPVDAAVERYRKAAYDYKQADTELKRVYDMRLNIESAARDAYKEFVEARNNLLKVAAGEVDVSRVG